MIDYELKHTNPSQTRLNDDGSATIVQGFTTGVVGVPDSYGMIAGDTITIVIGDYANKTITQAQAEVLESVNAYIANKYPST